MAHLREHFMFDRDKIIVDSVNDNKHQLQDKQKKKKKKKYVKKVSEAVKKMPQNKKELRMYEAVGNYCKKMDETFEGLMNDIVKIDTELSYIHTNEQIED